MSELERSKRLTALVTGTVQGVGYRRFVQRKANDLGLKGFAENLSDGKVEVVAEGKPSELEHLVHWLKRGTPHSSVSAVDVQWSEATGLRNFFVY
jgi:acylphosphatase